MGKKKDLKKQWIKMFEILQKKQIDRFKKLSEPKPIKLNTCLAICIMVKLMENKDQGVILKPVKEKWHLTHWRKLWV